MFLVFNSSHYKICSQGGTNTGPSPLELALMSLAGCGVIIYADVCKNSKIDPGTIEVAVEAEKSSSSPIHLQALS